VSGQLTVAQQANLIRQAVPGARNRFDRGRLICTAALQPTEQSCTYIVEVSYKPGTRPAVRVRDPALELWPGTGALPHVYPGDELCLNYPGEWDSSMSVGHTILPWASEWLLHYEIWLVTGEWTGGGVHQDKDP
jgi:hypothetical protein